MKLVTFKGPLCLMFIIALFRHFLLIILIISCSAYASDLDIAFGQNRPPFIINNNGELQGLEVDIVRESLAYKGHTIKTKIPMPNARLAIAVAKMNFDAAAGVQYLDDNTFYSDNFITYINYAISRKKDNLAINNIADLTLYRAVAWQNAYRNLGAEYQQFFGPEATGLYLDRYSEFANQEYQNEFFWKARADVIIVDIIMFQWFRQALSKKYDTNEEMVFHKIFNNDTQYQMNFKNEELKNEELKNDFNQGLKHIQSTGKYQQLIDSYVHQVY